MDDERSFRTATGELLRIAGFECEECESPRSALPLIAEGDFAALVLDLVVDGRPQIEFLRNVTSLADAPSVILVTGHPSVESATAAIDLGFGGYLRKPFEIEGLVRRIDEAIRRRGLVKTLEETYSSLLVASDGLSHLVKIVSSGALGTDGSAVTDATLAGLLGRLTPREREIVDELLRGYRVCTIGQRLGISSHTVRRHLKSIFVKLEVKSQVQLLEKLKP